VILGNTCLYGATSGKLFAAGQAGERFAVRNSGALAVVEGCGANGCEYMTGGAVVVLGGVDPNFGAGMTGGMAFVYDVQETFESMVNPETVVFQRIASRHWAAELRKLVEEHAARTGSALGASLLEEWPVAIARFWQICPKEMLARLTPPLADVAMIAAE
jgi:glutamate synthase (NADPH/NADH) large chain